MLMSSVFLSHTKHDKLFVEKLAKGLKSIGVNVWYDNWMIQPGDSITWKIEEGINENEYLGIVMTPEAFESQWVKSELGAAWIKQMNTKKILVIPILYRNCNIPLFLADRKYADFREDYEIGFSELVRVLGIKRSETICEDNWRTFKKLRNVDWKRFREIEFENLITILVDRAIEYNWSSKVGASKNPYSITFYTGYNQHKPMKYVSIKLDKKTTAYLATFKQEWNSNNLKSEDYDIYIGNTVNQCEEFIWRVFEEYKRKWGDPDKSDGHHTFRFVSAEKKMAIIRDLLKELHWYKGDKLF